MIPVLSALLLLCSCAPLRNYDIFERFSQPLGTIPLLNEDYVPQGVCIAGNYAVFSLYSDDDACAVAAIQLSDGELVGSAKVKYDDGTFCTNHASGIAFDGKNFWYAHTSGVYRISRDSFLKGLKSGYVVLEEYIDLGITAAYLSFGGGLLTAGEFVNTGGHSGEHDFGNNGAYAMCFRVSYEDGDTPSFERADDATVLPEAVLSVPDKVQGIAVSDDGSISLSTSYGRMNKSTLYYYSKVLGREQDGSVTIGGRRIKLYYLDKYKAQGAPLMPPMSENLCAVDDKLYLIFESGAHKYSFGVVDKTEKLYCFELGEYSRFLDKQRQTTSD